MAARKGVRGRERRLTVLVRVRRQRLLRAAARPRVPAWLAAGKSLPALRRRAGAPPGVPDVRATRDASRRLRRGRRCRSPFHRAQTAPRGELAPERKGVPRYKARRHGGRRPTRDGVPRLARPAANSLNARLSPARAVFA